MVFGLLDAIFELVRRNVDAMPWHEVKQWRPFSIDALGLVTLLGAEEANKALGTLERRRYTEYLPFLAAFIIAGDRFADEQAGHSLYNITDGITTTELKGFFTRWLSSQRVLNATTIFRWQVSKETRKIGLTDLVAPLLSFVAVAPLLVSTILMGDWFGLGNACAIVCSILVRSFILWQRRRALDSVAAPETVVDVQTSLQSEKLPRYREKSLPSTPSTHSSLESVRQLHRESSAPTSDDIVKLLVTRADGKMITIYTPRQILNIFVREAKLSHPRTYHLVRYCGWAAFGVQMCILGMASLFTQIYTVVLLVFSTWAMSHSFDFDVGRKKSTAVAEDGTLSEYMNTHFGNKLEVEQENPWHGEGGGVDKRMHAYVRLQPTDRQEAMLKHWSMLPFEGVPWYDNYYQAKVDYAASVARVPLKPPLLSDPSQRSSTTQK
ncbi:hypothetical protein CKM354_000630000 [Cercospora kikuchii]|uniref:Uncharacterized protein n=1 Tax=Cercospora kikuchii TaxID=84275 RepID=A0A9P3CKH8_9PEZI|nr:uncharacterized protein CKM354_000630000 [Cercospora kikuchii]GIZ43057.1 hypothetical protein CKM354_000630000 [Cercospora kikuchii]